MLQPLTVTHPPPRPPGPRPRVPGRFLLAREEERLRFFRELAQRYGDVVYFSFLGRDIYLVSYPDLIREVLVTKHRAFHKGRGLQRAKMVLGEGLLTSEGAFHLRQRRLIQPAFHRRRLHTYAGTMIRYAQRTSERWQDGATLDVAEAMQRLTLAIVGKALFNADVEEEAPTVGAALEETFNVFTRLNHPLGPLLDRLPLPSNRRFARAIEKLDAVIAGLIDERRATGDQGDLLSMLLLARDEEGDGTGMSDQQVRDEALTLFLAGHETTANALAWSWYLLSQNPAAEARLHAEVDEVLAGLPPTPDDWERLPFARQVLSESMRLYPPAWTIGRTAIEDVEIGGYVIPEGATVLTSQWVVHHDPRYYPDPFCFDPDRWTAAAQAARPKFAYFPFGGGPRLCIGEGFAWMEGVLVLATLAQRWRLRLVPGHPVEPLPRITLRPKYGIRMTVHHRQGGEQEIETRKSQIPNETT